MIEIDSPRLLIRSWVWRRILATSISSLCISTGVFENEGISTSLTWNKTSHHKRNYKSTCMKFLWSEPQFQLTMCDWILNSRYFHGLCLQYSRMKTQEWNRFNNRICTRQLSGWRKVRKSRKGKIRKKKCYTTSLRRLSNISANLGVPENQHWHI